MTWQDAIDIIACEAWAVGGRVPSSLTRGESAVLLRWRELRMRALRAGWRAR